MPGKYCENTVDGVWYGKAELNLQRYGTGGKIIKGFSHCEEHREADQKNGGPSGYTVILSGGHPACLFSPPHSSLN